MTASPAFTEWLHQRKNRRGAVGDLARDVAADKCWPESGGYEAYVAHLKEEHHACDSAVRALARAWKAYGSEHPSS